MTEPHLRYTAGDKVSRYGDSPNTATVLGPAVFHEVGTSHHPDTTYHNEHETEAFWCYHLEMGGSWGTTKRRWWPATSISGREDVIEKAIEKYEREVSNAARVRDHAIEWAATLSSRETEVIDGRRHTPQPDGTCSGCSEVFGEFLDSVESP